MPEKTYEKTIRAALSARISTLKRRKETVEAELAALEQHLSTLPSPEAGPLLKAMEDVKAPDSDVVEIEGGAA